MSSEVKFILGFILAVLNFLLLGFKYGFDSPYYYVLGAVLGLTMMLSSDIMERNK